MIRTVEQATKAFLSKSKTKLKESTYSRYSFICDRHIIPYFQGIKLNQLSNQAINDFIEYKLQNGGLNGKALSPKTVNDIVSLLTQIIRSHIQFDIDIEKPQYIQEEISVFTDIEYSKLKSYLNIGTDNKKLGIIIAMLTGISCASAIHLSIRAVHSTDFIKIVLSTALSAVIFRFEIPCNLFAVPLEFKFFQLFTVRNLVSFSYSRFV